MLNNTNRQSDQQHFPHFLTDVLKKIAVSQQWKLKDVLVSKFNLGNARIGRSMRYEVRLRIGRNDLYFGVSDDVVSWKKLKDVGGGGGDDFETLISEVGSLSLIDSLKLEGPFELRVDGSDDLSLFLPVLDTVYNANWNHADVRNKRNPSFTMSLQEVIRDRTQAATKIAKHVLLTEAKDKNLVFSPVAIHLVLALIAAGSKGRTLEQMRVFMNSEEQLISLCTRLLPVLFSDGKDALGGPKLSFVNGVWIDDKSLFFTPGFKNVLDTVCLAVPNQSEFHSEASEAANEVNLWAEEKSGGLIKDFLPSGSVTGSTRLMFANAIFYKGDWADHMFNRSKTKDGEFHLLNRSSVQVPFMTSGNSQLISVFDGFKVLGLRYRQGADKLEFYMYIFLPDENDGLPSLVEKLCADSEFLDSYRPVERVLVRDFKIPRFKISFGFEASKVLKDLGLVLPFSGEEGDLSEMVYCTGNTTKFEITEIPCVSSIFHKSILEVDEEGAEAASYPAGTTLPKSILEVDEEDFVADHPFLFMIWEEVTGVPLLVGHVLNPLDG